MLKRILSVGLLVGLLSGVLSSILYVVLCEVMDLSFTQLNPASIMVVSVIVNVIGAWIYHKLWHATARPRWYYGMITVGVALILSLYDWASPPEPDIAGVANTLHALTASLSIALIPTFLRRRR